MECYNFSSNAKTILQPLIQKSEINTICSHFYQKYGHVLLAILSAKSRRQDKYLYHIEEIEIFLL